MCYYNSSSRLQAIPVFKACWLRTPIFKHDLKCCGTQRIWICSVTGTWTRVAYMYSQHANHYSNGAQSSKTFKFGLTHIRSECGIFYIALHSVLTFHLIQLPCSGFSNSCFSFRLTMLLLVAGSNATRSFYFNKRSHSSTNCTSHWTARRKKLSLQSEEYSKLGKQMQWELNPNS